MTEMLLYLYAESPVHAGGTDADGVIDLPIQREASTRYPVIWGQSLKGALRQAWRDRGFPDAERLFGSADDAASNAGRLSVGDAQLVALPVATLRNTFAWVTSGLALSRLARKYGRIGQDAPAAVPVCGSDSCLAVGGPWTAKEALGPAVTSVESGNQHAKNLDEWAKCLARDSIGSTTCMEPLAGKLTGDLLLAGETLAGLLFSQCTEQSARVQLKADQKTVENGPFVAEYLPSDTILAASLTLKPNAEPVWLIHLKALLGTPEKPGLLQVGGDETIGKGLVWTTLLTDRVGQ